MFAFAIWDAAEEQLFLARDRFGEKPLFVHEQGDNLVFASEIKGLLAVPGLKREVNLPAVWDYLAYRYAPGPKTLFTGIRKILPGTCATWKRGRFTERRYWTAPDRKAYKATAALADTEQTFLSTSTNRCACRW
jgi:asparagine synthase (glutamine-hydrolysing)